MAGKVVSGAATGAALGSAILPGIGSAVGAAGGAVVGFFEGLFKSKKHYNLYYWDNAASSWIYVMEGHPDAVNKTAKSYSASGITTQIVRNKSGSAAAPTKPPAGATVKVAAVTGLNPWILAGIAAAGGLLFFLVRRKR